jgi:hypothetical protein
MSRLIMRCMGEESFEEKLEYIRQKPVRRGLVTVLENYRWLWLG